MITLDQARIIIGFAHYHRKMGKPEKKKKEKECF
jgi:hypothetical protein